MRLLIFDLPLFLRQNLLLMRILYVFILTALIGSGVKAQEITVKKLQSEITRTVKKEITDTLPWTWKRGGLVNVNISQGSLSNWAAGGDRFSMAINTYLNYFVFYKQGNQNWDNNLDFNFGFVESTSLGSRKNDDRLDMLSKYGYKFNGKLYLTGLFNFRTQFFDGYTYPNPQGVFSSTLLSPAYVLTSAGIDYKPNDNFSAFVSPLTSRWVIVASKYLSDKGSYGVDSGRRSMNEVGAFASVNYRQILPRNITYKGRMDLFSNYANKPGNVDVFMTNYFAFKINKYFSVNYNLDLIYDDDVRLFGDEGTSAGLQVKSLIGIGFLMRFK